jgi:SSS family solute:Na+ symporter
LLFVLGLDRQNALNMQLLGGVWILQTIVAIVCGLYTRWFHRWALLLGWAAGMVYGTIQAYRQEVPVVVTKLVNGEAVTSVNGTRHFGSPLANFPFTDTKVYIAGTALLINIVVAVIVTVVLRAVHAPAGVDETQPADYHADAPSVAVVAATDRELAGQEGVATGPPGGQP